MAKLIGFKTINTAVFISGKGSNLKSIIRFSKIKKISISVKLIVTNNPNSKGLIYGKVFGIKKKFLIIKKNIAEKQILIELKKNNIKLICLAGFMKILSKISLKNLKEKY